MYDGVRCFVFVGILEYGKIFCIFMVRIVWKNFICLVGGMYIKDKDIIIIEGIINFFENIFYFYFILYVVDRI